MNTPDSLKCSRCNGQLAAAFANGEMTRGELAHQLQHTLSDRDVLLTALLRVVGDTDGEPGNDLALHVSQTTANAVRAAIAKVTGD